MFYKVGFKGGDPHRKHVQYANSTGMPSIVDQCVEIPSESDIFLNTLTVEFDTYGSEQFDSLTVESFSTVEQTIEFWISGFG